MPGERAISGSRSIPISLTTFQSELRRRWKILKEEEAALVDTYHIFAEKKEVWPDQCKNMLMLLYRVQHPVRELRALLENPTNLPASVVQQRHLLLMAIQHTDEQNQILIKHITEFRTLCQNPSKQAAKQRQEIEYELYVFLREYDEVVSNIASLLDWTRFQERKLMPGELQQRGELSREAPFYKQQELVYSEQARKEMVEEYLEEACWLARKLEDCEREGLVLNDSAGICSASGKQEEALYYLEKVLVVVKEITEHLLEEQVQDNNSVVCIHLRWLEEAKIHIEEVLALMKEIAAHLQEGGIQRLKFVK
jgi:tetratricopeptide (TPR) repeat protein